MNASRSHSVRCGSFALAGVLAIATVGGGAPRVAQAAPPSSPTTAKAQPSPYEEAVQAFERRDFPRAIAMFEAAYAADPNPNFLYNIGRVYEEKGDLPQALVYYRRFVRAEGVDLDTRAMVSERIAKLKKVLGESEDAPEPESEAGAEPPAPSPSSTASSTSQFDDDMDGEPLRQPGKLGIAGYVVLGIGGAALISSGIVGLLAMNANRRLEGQEPLDDPRGAQARGRTLAWTGDGLLIAGSAVAITGVALVIADAVARRRKRARAMAWSPMPAPGGAGLSYGARF